MTVAGEKDTVIISYTGKLDNGEIFKAVPPEEPITVQIGNSELPPTVEIELIGMKKGQTKKIKIPPDEGYGPRLKELLHEVPRANFGDKIVPKPGMILSQKIEKDGVIHDVPVTVIENKEDLVVIDYNHPLAGHHLTFELTLLDIK